ncbi:MAG: GNAT family N-acetyltransferase [Actinomycetota bacterium]|nr:GNAT family N-acetyltransferase [Actinomycetota bacterium]
MSVEVSPVTPGRFGELATVFGRRGRNASWCWCRLFLGAANIRTVDGEPDNREEPRREIESSSIPPGLIASIDGIPVGWSRIGPRASFPRVLRNRALTRTLPEDPGAWWVTCFAVDTSSRGRGVGGALLAGVVQFGRDNGATAVEGHPVDVDDLEADRVSGSALFTGTLAMFAAARFNEIGRTYRTRPVMRLEF